MVILDTCILIDISRGNDYVSLKMEKFQNRPVYVSAVTKFEFIAGARNKTDFNNIIFQLDNYISIPLSQEINDIFINLGKTYALSHKLSVPDMLIAATAIYYDLPLFTTNTKDFQFIPALKLID